jgi:ketosteroid isomerase-like protein
VTGAVGRWRRLARIVGGEVHYWLPTSQRDTCAKTAEEFKQDPGNRLRLTVGLRKEGGRWVVAHEHHSFPNTSQA